MKGYELRSGTDGLVDDLRVGKPVPAPKHRNTSTAAVEASTRYREYSGGAHLGGVHLGGAHLGGAHRKGARPRHGHFGLQVKQFRTICVTFCIC